MCGAFYLFAWCVGNVNVRWLVLLCLCRGLHSKWMRVPSMNHLLMGTVQVGFYIIIDTHASLPYPLVQCDRGQRE